MAGVNQQSKKSPFFVSDEVAKSVLSIESAIEAIQAAYSQLVDHQNTPPRTIARDPGAMLRALPAAPVGSPYFGAKFMGVTSDPQAGTFAGAGWVIVLFGRDPARVAGFVDGKFITGLRTAATSAAALDRLAPAGPIRLGVLGSGFEASMHVRAFAAVRPLQDITVYSPTPERRVEFAETMSAELGVPCHVVESAEHASKAFRETADVVLAAARSYGEKPILFAEDLKPGATVVSIGSTVPHQREIDVSVVECCDLVVCDEVGEVIEQTGDMRAATEEGLAVQDKCASLHSLMTGAADDALAKSQIRMFKSVGSGLQDVVIAGVALDRAIEAGTAQSLPITFST